MTYANPSETGFAGATSGLPLSGLWAGVAQRLAQRRAYRQTVKELAALTDRELADIGVFRDDIRTFARIASRTV